ncbi:MAG: hypothetical protein ACAH35_02625 [Candidatus Paceibacterota bacterium]
MRVWFVYLFIVCLGLVGCSSPETSPSLVSEASSDSWTSPQMVDYVPPVTHISLSDGETIPLPGGRLLFYSHAEQESSDGIGDSRKAIAYILTGDGHATPLAAPREPANRRKEAWYQSDFERAAIKDDKVILEVSCWGKDNDPSDTFTYYVTYDLDNQTLLSSTEKRPQGKWSKGTAAPVKELSGGNYATIQDKTWLLP